MGHSHHCATVPPAGWAMLDASPGIRRTMTDLVLIALAWLAYGALHSWLAANQLKQDLCRRWPGLAAGYRLLYNLLALLLLLPPLWLTLRLPGEALWHWPAWVAWPALGLAVAGFVWSLRWYDGLEFLGIRPWRRQTQDPGEGEALAISPLHRYVRHPWYSLGLLLLWSRDLNAAWLVTALVVTLYVWIGSRLEEAKLIAQYGDRYRRYRDRVPALIPNPWRHLRATEVEALLRPDRRIPGDESP